MLQREFMFEIFKYDYPGREITFYTNTYMRKET